jgi:hypothetical protein
MLIDLGRMRRGFCDRVTRRQALRVGGVGWLAGLSLPRLLELETLAASATPAKAQSCIFLWLDGGPSTIDMWDLKPEAPSEIRGPYLPIATNVPGTFVGEHCRLCAETADKFTILRTHSHQDNGHTTGNHYFWTGYKPDFADGTNSRVPVNVLYPSLGSVVGRELGSNGSVPAYVNMPNALTSGGPGFYGAEFAPFVIQNDPVQPDFEVKDLRPPDGVGGDRQERRRRTLAGLEGHSAERAAGGRAGTMATYYEKAHDLVASAQAREAFNINAEPEEVRSAYGHTSLGQCAVLGRRLVEAGCRFVGIDHGSWDTHFTCFPSLENDLIPHADRAFAALVRDLDERGLLESTLVVMMGEMGRTPRVNAEAGRDHWSNAQSVLFAGGGTVPGQVIGATDSQASAPLSDPVSIGDILATIYHLMGIDWTKTYYTPLGRPVPIVTEGRIIEGLV